MRILSKILIFVVSLNVLSAEVTDWDALAKLIENEDIRKYADGYDELGKLVEHHIESQTDNSKLRAVLYDLLDDEREGGRLSNDEYIWNPKIIANLLLIKLSGYIEDHQKPVDSNLLPPVDEALQIASSEKRRDKFRVWYEKKFLDLESERKLRPSKEPKLDDLPRRETIYLPSERTQGKENIAQREVAEKKQHNLLWVITGLLLLGTLALFLKVWKAQSE